jgi:tetratricopeptide (TPR) repeat protein
MGKAAEPSPRQTALNAYRSGDYETARVGLQAYLKNAPEDPEAIAALAMTYAKLGHFPEAQGLIETLIVRRPQSVSANYYKAQILDLAGRSGEALNHYRYVLELQPDHPRAAAKAQALVQKGVTPAPKPPSAARAKVPPRIVQEPPAESEEFDLATVTAPALSAATASTPAQAPPPNDTSAASSPPEATASAAGAAPLLLATPIDDGKPN